VAKKLLSRKKLLSEAKLRPKGQAGKGWALKWALSFPERAILFGMQYWMVKQEPEDYSWGDLERDGRTAWTGVRNFQARNNLRGMKRGDSVLFYHSVTEKQVVGLAKVAKEAYPDPTAKEGDWSCVDLAPVKALKRPVSLEVIKTERALADIPLLRQSRLSVMALTAGQFKCLLKLGGTAL
jgi:predicted RNA-binding protein with PUA-like domain